MTQDLDPAPDLALQPGFLAAMLEDDPEDLYQNAPCAYISTAPDGTIAKVNRTFLHWTGYLASDLIGEKRWQDLLSPGDRIFFETHLAPALRLQGRAREIAVDITATGGRRIPVLLNAVMKLDADGHPLVIRIVLFDATERRAYEHELVVARQRAEASEQRAAALATTLQASLLPSELVATPGLDVGGAYRPSGDGSEVGGDFYDVVELSPTSWAFLLGDVCGKGPDAAVLTALARDTVRRELLRTHSPVEVLGAVRDVLLRYHPTRFCTAVMVVLSVSDDGVEMRSAVAGHHLPLLRHEDGTYEGVGVPGTLLGLIADGTTTEHRSMLRSGDTLALYTDGVPEARRDKEFFEHARVQTVMDQLAGGSAQACADGLVDAALAFQSGWARDDMAVIAITVP